MAHSNSLAARLDEEPQSHADAVAYLGGALRRIGMTRPALQAQMLCPPLQSVLTRLAYFITDAPVRQYTGRCVLDTTLEAGLIAFFSGSNHRVGGPAKFAQAALARAGDLLSIQVRRGSAVWDPWGDIPLGAWLVDRGGFAIAHQQLPGDPILRAFRAHVLDRITTPTELQALQIAPDFVLQPPR